MNHAAKRPIISARKLPVFRISELKYSVVFEAMALITGIAITK